MTTVTMNRNVRNVAIVLAACVFAPSLAHAEFKARPEPEVRTPVTVPARGKSSKPPARVRTTKDEHGAASSRIAMSTRAAAPATTPALSVDGVLGKITTAYMPGLQRCYRKALVTNPSISGKVSVLFTVDARGRVTSDLATRDAKLDRCLMMTIAGWRFPHEGEPAELTFKVSLMLRQ